MAPRRKTSTSNFGVGARESHDSTPFYDRFRAPELSNDNTVLAPTPIAEPFVCGDARFMHTIADGSVALVVTSPPYFAGKQYEEELEKEGIPASYLEYLDMLTAVFAECVRKLEPGGRIAVNIANLGRKPYRSLSADVIRILEHDLGLLLRGELIWQKGEGANGSCAWGSFRSAANPVLRDITERVIVASKGRFDRARTVKQRAAEGLPHRNTIMTEDFLALSLDVWSMPPESARRVGHPAPFPVELPDQLIHLYTFEDDLVLDPFMGSGSALVAAALSKRRYVGYDLDQAYVDTSRRRVTEALNPPPTHDRLDGRAEAHRLGKASAKMVASALEVAGFTITATDAKMPKTGTSVSYVASDAKGATWYFDVAGAFTNYRGGMLRSDVVWKTLGRAAAMKQTRGTTPLVLLTTNLPRHRSEGDQALRAAGPELVSDIIDILSLDGQARLAECAAGTTTTQAGFWATDAADRPKR